MYRDRIYSNDVNHNYINDGRCSLPDGNCNKFNDNYNHQVTYKEYNFPQYNWTDKNAYGDTVLSTQPPYTDRYKYTERYDLRDMIPLSNIDYGYDFTQRESIKALRVSTDIYPLPFNIGDVVRFVDPYHLLNNLNGMDPHLLFVVDDIIGNRMVLKYIRGDGVYHMRKHGRGVGRCHPKGRGVRDLPCIESANNKCMDQDNILIPNRVYGAHTQVPQYSFTDTIQSGEFRAMNYNHPSNLYNFESPFYHKGRSVVFLQRVNI